MTHARPSSPGEQEPARERDIAGEPDAVGEPVESSADAEVAVAVAEPQAEPQAEAQAPEAPGPIDRVLSRIHGDPRFDRAWRWGLPIAVIGVAAALRFTNLGFPHELVFDETFYVKDSYAMWQVGHETSWSDDANDLFVAGDASGMQSDPSFVVHPPLGKWILGVGMALGGIADPFMWRWPAALIGVLLVAATFFVAKGLMRSTGFGALAALLLAIDGQAIVMSRTALLDGTLALFVLLGAGFVLLDQRGSPARLVRWRAAHPGRLLGPAIWGRPWLIAAGVMLGAACAVKWSGMYYLAALGLWVVCLEMLDRRRAGIPSWALGTLLKQAPVSFVLLVPTALVVYVASFAGWLQGGYQRFYMEQHASDQLAGVWSWVPLWAQDLWHYHQVTYAFHVGLSKDHPFQSPAAEWLALLRPTAFYLHMDGDEMSYITSLANPLIWYLGVIALAVLLWRVGARFDRLAGLLVVAVMAGYLPWLAFPDRTIFSFYTIVFEPFLYIGLAVVLWRWVGGSRAPAHRRLNGQLVVAVVTVCAIAFTIFFAPIWYGMWQDMHLLGIRFWLPGWR